MGKRYQNFIFDLYGTLVDIHTDESRPDFWAQVSLLASLKGAPWGAEELRARYRARVQTEVRRVRRHTGPGSLPEPDLGRVFRTLFAEKGAALSDGELADFALAFRALSLERLGLYPGAAELLDDLRRAGRGVYLLSNAQALFTRPELRLLGLLDRFDGVLLSSEAGRKKPDPAFFRLLMERYGLSCEDTVMVGNDDLSDCRGAAAVGLDSLYICTEQSPRRTSPLPNRCVELDSIRDAAAFAR